MLTNKGTAALTITNIEVTGPNAGDFNLTNNCTSALAPQAQCPLSITFKPTAVGTRTASLVFTDNASGSPQTVALTGSGTSAQVGLSSTTLTFGSQLVGTSTPVQSITLTNSGDAVLNISSILVTGSNPADFPETTTCGSSVAAGGTCTISVTFTPTAPGSRTAAITISDSATGSPQTVSLTGTGTSPIVSLSANSLAFGSQNLGTTSAGQNVTLNNTGNAPLGISGISLAGANPGDFSETTTCGSSVAAGGSCTISIKFTPTSAGNRSASVVIADNAGGSPQMITLTGSGAGIFPFASLSTNNLTFGSQSLGTPSPTLAVTLSNTGNATLIYTPPIPITGTNSGDFSESDNCAGSVAAGANCTISVIFTPSAVGTRTATLTLTSNASNSPQMVSLTGTGTSSTVSLAPSALTFASQTVATTSTAQTVTLTNTGNASLSVNSLALTGTNAGDFGQTNSCGSSVAAGSSCTINVTFTPTAPGTRTAAVTISDNAAGSPQSVSLTGTGSGAAISLTTTSLNFNTQTIGIASAVLPVTVSNTGTAPLTITSITVTGVNAGDFAQTTTCGNSLPAGGNCSVGVTFTPTAPGTRTASVMIADNASGSPQAVSLTGMGQGPVVVLTPSSLTYAGVSVGSTSGSQTLTVNNTGNAALSISGISFSGTNASEFSQTTTCGSSLAAGSSCTISVTFTPAASGTRTASLVLTDNASNSPQTVTLTGTGNAPGAELSTASLTFTSQNVGTSSTAQTVTLNNTGNTTLTISGSAFTGANPGDFGKTTTCGSTLAGSSSCTISVTFTPAAAGTRTASLTITDNDNNVAGSQQSTVLTGTGAGPAASFNLSSLTFGSQTENTTSAPQSVTLTNMGSASLAITGISLTGTNPSDFAQTNTCGTTVAVNATCTISVTFTPTAASTLTAAVSVADNAGGSPQTVTLTGEGLSGQIGIAPSSLTFASQVIGVASGGQSAVLTNTGNASFTISSVSITGADPGDFSQANTCLTSLTPNATCAIIVKFTPTAPGIRTASISITDTLGSSPQTVVLSGTGSGPAISFSPASLTFATQGLGTTSAAQSVTVTNTGNASLTITSISTTGANPGDYAVTNTCGGSVAVNANCTISVTFTPLANGSRTASVSIADNAGGSPQTISLTGTGSSPIAGITATSLAFISQNLGTTSTAQTVTLNNNGNAALSISSIAFTGANPGDFAYTTTCGSSLAANSNCTISVTFTPAAPGSRSATLNITDNTNGVTGSQQSVSLAGTGSGPAVSYGPNSLTFNSQTLGTTSAAQTVELSNTGNTALTITNLAVTGADPGDFSQTNNCGASVAAGGNCTINVTFTPTALGSRSATISITDNANGSPQLVALTGAGTAPVASLSPNLVFGNQPLLTTSASQTATLSNTGNVSLTITSISITGMNSGDFSQTNTCGSSLAVGSNCTVTVTFTPTGVGSRTASISITDNAPGSPQTVSLTGTGTGPVVSLTATSLNFGTQAVGSPSPSQTVTLNNIGNTTLNISTLAVTGANSGDFAQTNTCGTPVAAGGSCTISVTFTPTATGARSASVTITDNASDSPETISLTGTGSGPVASLTASSLSFSSQNTGTTSPAQTITLNNTGNASLSITSITLSGTNAGDYAQTNTCGSSVAASSSCTISVTFMPIAPGTRTATLTVTDNNNNVAGSTQSASLTGTGTGPAVSFSPSSLTFPSEPLGVTSPSQSFTLTNTGNATLNFTNFSVTGTNSGDFGQSNTCGSSLAAGVDCTVTVTFTPTAVGSRSALMSVTDNASGSPQTLSLTGTGSGPLVSLTPSSLTFTTQSVGTTSPAQTVTVNNTGNATLNISTVMVTGTNSGDFAESSTCGSPVAAGNSCTISVTFTPSSPGSRSASVSIADNAAGSPQTVSLTGMGSGPIAALTPTLVTFPNQNVGSTSAAQTVTLNNTGNASLSVASVTLTGTNSGDYAQTNNCGTAVAANSSCTISVTITPGAPGTRTATLTVTDNNNNVTGSTQSASLTGTGTGVGISISPPSLTFGSQSVGVTSSSQSVTVTNTGNVNLSFTSIAATGDFAIATVGTTCSTTTPVAGGANCVINVTFTPTATGTRSGNLALTDNAPGSPQSVGLAGTGLSSQVSLSPSSLTFTSQSVGTTSAALGSTLSTTGSLTLNSITITGANAGDFTLAAGANSCPYTGGSVTAGGSCTIYVTFNPTAPFIRTASVMIADNASGSPQTMTLTGTGSAPTAGVTVTSLTFSSQNLGSTSTAQTFTLNNTGNATLTISTIAFSGANPSDFGETNTCNGSVAAGGNCVFSVTFTPTATGTRAATLTLTDNNNNTGGSQQSVALTGTGSAPIAGVTTTSLTFASQTLNTTSTAQNFMLNNTGNAALSITGIGFTGANPGDFAQTNTCGSSVAAGGNCTISVTFTPTAIGSRTASLNITDNSGYVTGSQQSVALTGTGSGATVSLNPSTLNFTTQPQGTTSPAQGIMLTNTGNANLTITSISVTGTNAGDFAQTNTCVNPIAPNGTCTINVTFTPGGILSRTASLSIADNANGSPQNVTLTGAGSAPIAGITTTSLTFSSQNLGTTSAAQTFTLNNSGNAALIISTIAFTGANPGDFGETNTCNGSVAASGSCTLSVTFAPTGTGTRAATLTITDNSNNAAGSQQSVSLTGTGSAPTASVTTTSLTFASQTLSTTSTAQTFMLNNTGNALLSVGSFGFTGANPGDFGQTNTCGSSVAAGGNCTISVTFTPTAIGSRTATLKITDNSNYVTGSQQSVSLTGTGTSPIVSLNTSALTFSSQTQGTTSSAQSITVTNTGNVSLSVTSVSLTGANPGDFAETNTCSGPVAANGGTCTINVTFTPTAILGRTASVSIADNAPGSPQSVTLTGTGTASVATFSVSTLNFGIQPVLTTSPSQTFTLTNTGNMSLTVTSISVTGTNAGDYGETNNCPLSPSSLAAGSFCTVTVAFTPSAAGTRTASVNFADNATAGSPQAVSLTGIGSVGTVGLSASSLIFGSQSVGTTSTVQTVILTNTGNALLAITSIAVTGANPGDFAQNNNCGTSVGVNASCMIHVTFSPTTSGSRTATLTFTDGATNSPQTVSLTGTGTAPLAVLSPTTFTFSSQPAATSSSPESFTLSNLGNATLNITNIVFTGSNSGDFGQDTTCDSSLAASGNCTIVVTFTPAAAGSRSGTLLVTDNSNNTNGSTQSSTLAGTAVHDVILSWTPSSTAGVVGYFVYRGTTPGGEATTPLNSSPYTTATLTYVDTNVTAGATYYYMVTAVASDGYTQSLPSNEASATVPTP